MHPKHTEAAERFRDRQRREDEAPRLSDRVPDLKNLRLSIAFSRGDASVQPSHTRVVVVQRAPALFVVPCANKDCKNGGHDITQQVLDGLRDHKTTFTGTVRCSGELANGSLCDGELQFEANAEF